MRTDGFCYEFVFRALVGHEKKNLLAHLTEEK